jgi:uncharacterized protein (TIGR02246 family)
MKSIMLIVAFFCLVSAVFAQSEEDKKAIKSVILSFHSDFNDGSFKNAETYTTEDWEHINPLGGIDKGRANVLKTVRGVHQSFLKGVTMTLEDFSLRFITPDVAIADAIDKMSDFTTPDGTKHQNERHIKTYVLVKKNGKWLLTHDHNTIIL